MSINFNEQTKVLFDALSLTTVLATLTAWLPPLAALASIIWTGIRIYETATVQRWLTCHKFKKHALKDKS